LNGARAVATALMATSNIEDIEKHGIFNAVFEAFYSFLDAGIRPDLSGIAGPPYHAFRVAVRHQGKQIASSWGEGSTAGEQLADAVTRACHDPSFGGLTRSCLQSVSLDIWIQTHSEHVAVADRHTDFGLLSGSTGVEVQWNDARHHFDPAAILHGRFKSPADLLDRLCESAGLFAGAWKEPFCQVRKTGCVHVVGRETGKSVELRALRATPAIELSTEDLQRFVGDGTCFLINNQLASGDYCYIYQALDGEGAQSKPNSVRASGCAYAVASALRVVPTDMAADASRSARRAVRAILERTGRWVDDSLIVREGRGDHLWGKLGSTALLAVALLELDDPSFHPNALAALIRALKAAQGLDGSFDCFPGTSRPAGPVVNFYPGEALLALAITGARGDPEALECCKRAFEPYKAHFRESPSSAFVGWHADVWSRLSLTIGSEEYAAFVFEQLDWLLPFQSHSGPEHGAFLFDDRPGNVSSTVYTEAMIRGADLAYKLGHDDRSRRYSIASAAGLKFCARLQLDSSSKISLPNGHRAIGGVTSNLRTFQVRADNVQHMMTMAQAALERPACLSGALGNR
jgi:hypothetical protein